MDKYLLMRLSTLMLPRIISAADLVPGLRVSVTKYAILNDSCFTQLSKSNNN